MINNGFFLHLRQVAPNTGSQVSGFFIVNVRKKHTWYILNMYEAESFEISKYINHITWQRIPGDSYLYIHHCKKTPNITVQLILEFCRLFSFPRENSLFPAGDQSDCEAVWTITRSQ
jgi:hypothetical protein